jgi:hypothetical protein
MGEKMASDPQTLMKEWLLITHYRVVTGKRGIGVPLALSLSPLFLPMSQERDITATTTKPQQVS